MKKDKKIFIKIIVFCIVLCLTKNTIFGIIKQEELINFLGSNDIEKRDKTRKELIILGEEILPLLEKKIENKDWSIRYEIVKVLSEIKADKSTDILSKIVVDKNEKEDIRIIAIKSLKDRKVKTDIFVNLLNDENYHIRYYSIDLIKEDTTDIKQIDAIKKRLLIEKDWRIKKNIATKLSKLHNLEPSIKIDYILKVLKEECENPIIFKEKEGENRLVEPITGSRYIYDLVAVGLPAIHLLKEEVKKENGYIKEIIIITLGLLKDKEVFSLLVDISLNSKEGWNRTFAVRALGEIGDKKAISVLKKALKDNYSTKQNSDVKVPAGYEYTEINYPVRQEAFFALMKLGVRVKQKGISPDEYHEYIIEEK